MVNKDEKDKIETLLEDISMLEQYIQDLFVFTPLPFCFINLKGMILEVNPAFLKETGYDEYDIVGKEIFVFIEKKVATEIIEDVIKKGSVENREISIKTKEGNFLPATFFAKSRKTKGEGVNGIFLSFFNLTDVKKKEEEIKKSKEKLEKKMEEMEKFNRLTVGRELKMAELKEKVNKLQKEVEKYKNR